MGRSCWPTKPEFAAAVAELEPDIRCEAGFSLHDVIAHRQASWKASNSIQLGLIGMQLALTALWRCYA